MTGTQLSLSDVQTFLQSVETGEEFSPQNQSQQQEGSQTNTGDQAQEGAPPVVTGQELLDNLNKEETEGIKKKEEEEKVSTNTEEISKLLSEQGLLYAFDDGSLPKTSEEFIDALKQSFEVNTTKAAQEAIQKEIEQLPISIQTIIEYGKSGLTSARDLEAFTSKVANFEDVTKLDPEKVEDQELIVYNQLINTGLSEQLAKSQLDILKSNNSLESVAKEVFPALKNLYKKEVELDIQRQSAKEEEIYNHINTNSVNVKFFLDEDNDYLPFKIDKVEHKAQVFELAAKVTGYQEDGSPVFGWEDKIKSLQYGDEKSYKKFMKVMNFLANDEYYESKTSKSASNKAIIDQHKKIKVTEVNKQNVAAAEGSQKAPVTIKRSGPLTID